MSKCPSCGDDADLFPLPPYYEFGVCEECLDLARPQYDPVDWCQVAQEEGVNRYGQPVDRYGRAL